MSNERSYAIVGSQSALSGAHKTVDSGVIETAHKRPTAKNTYQTCNNPSHMIRSFTNHRHQVKEWRVQTSSSTRRESQIMKRHWEECPRGEKPSRWEANYITMNPKGEIVLSRFTHQAAGAPESYLLLYDRLNNTIGLNPAGRSTRNAYPAGRRGKHGGRLINAWRLLQEFRITLNETIRFTKPELDEDGVLLLDLRNATPWAKRRSSGNVKG